MLRPVKTVTIDGFVNEDVQLLKIDVEGCELNAVCPVLPALVLLLPSSR